MGVVDRLLWALSLGAGAIVVGGVLLACALRAGGLRWSWALLGIPVSLLLLGPRGGLWGAMGCAVCLLAAVLGARRGQTELAAGADIADGAEARLGVLEVLRRALESRMEAVVARDAGERGWARLREGWLEIGLGEDGRRRHIPAGGVSGSHALIVGATGSGKTVSEAWIAGRLIEAGLGAVVLDPKGDALLEGELRAAAARRGAGFLAWTPEGPLAYNPYAHGSHSEIADRALAGETFTEPHYLRQAQRYVAQLVGAMQAVGVPLNMVSLAEGMRPRGLEELARKLPAGHNEQVLIYLDSLGERQRRELAGVRDRLAILAESDARPWLEPHPDRPELDLHRAVGERAVVYFRLDADRWPLLSAQLAQALVIDLVTLVAELQRRPTPTVVVLDELAAIASAQVARLFGRARSAGVSVILATQELADLRTAAGGGGALREQVLGNVHTILAHRQNVPESADLLASIAATRQVWVCSQQTRRGLLGQRVGARGSRRREHDYEIHPTRIKRLSTGQALLITPGRDQAPGIVRVHSRRTR
ncbi:MAG TPA: TraM recognition domain-containing protein [Solirubrobacteraceae bacterium]|nr:TraM recognition domain-containing protein [Solirubrobacteraceae bacterium]